MLTDQSLYIADAVGQVWTAALLGGLLAVLVLYFFLRDPRATAIIALTIPVSVIATFLPMQQAGVTLNIMSLGGLALGVGMLVDNSIVVLEAIDRRRRQGLDRREAAVVGARRGGRRGHRLDADHGLGLPPDRLRAGRRRPAVLRPGGHGLPLAAGVAAGLADPDPDAVGARARRRSRRARCTTLFALATPRRAAARPLDRSAWRRLTLPPVGDGPARWSSRLAHRAACSRSACRLLLAAALRVVRRGLVGRSPGPSTSLPAPLTRGARPARPRATRRRWRAALRRRWVVLPVAVRAVRRRARGGPAARAPTSCRTWPRASSRSSCGCPRAPPLETTAEIVDRDRGACWSATARFARVFSIVGSLPVDRLRAPDARREPGPDQLRAAATGRRPRTSGRGVDRVREVLALLPQRRGRAGSTRRCSPCGRRSRSRSSPTTSSELDGAAAASRDGAASACPAFEDVATTSEPGSPEITIELDRERAAALGRPRRSWSARSLRRQIRGEIVGQFREDEERIDIRLRASEPFRATAPPRSRRCGIRLPDGTAVPVSAVADGRRSDRGPAAIHRSGGARVAEVTRQGLGRGTWARPSTGVQDDARRRRACRPACRAPSWPDRTRSCAVSFDSLWLALALAIFLVYVVMASSSSRCVHPFVILLAVPLGIVGVVAALLVTADRGQRAGADRRGDAGRASWSTTRSCWSTRSTAAGARARTLDEAIVGAGRERLRPILMTTATTVLALLPMALGLGAGDELRAPLAITVIGGLTVATLLTLVVIPCLYRAIVAGADAVREPRGRRRRRRRRRRPRRETRPTCRSTGPVATLMLLVCLTVLGTVAVFHLPLDFMPVVQEPEVDVEVPFPGSHPLEGLREVVRPIEEEVATIPDVKSDPRSRRARARRESRSQFDWAADVDLKKMEVREAVERARDRAARRRSATSASRATRTGRGADGPRAAGSRPSAISPSRGTCSTGASGGRSSGSRASPRRASTASSRSRCASTSTSTRCARHGVAARRGAARASTRPTSTSTSARSAATCCATTCAPLARFRDVETIARPAARPRRAAACATWPGSSCASRVLDYGRHLNRNFAIGFDVFKEPTGEHRRDRRPADGADRRDRARPASSQGINAAGLEERRPRRSGRRSPDCATRAVRRPAGHLRAVPLPAPGAHDADRRRARSRSRSLVTCGAMFLLGSGVQRADPARADARRRHARRQRRRRDREHLPLRGAGHDAASRRPGSAPAQVALAVVASTATTIIVWSWLFVSEPNAMTIYIGAVALTICLAVVCSLLISLTFIPLAAARFVPRTTSRARASCVHAPGAGATARCSAGRCATGFVTLTGLFAARRQRGDPDRAASRRRASPRFQTARRADLLPGPRPVDQGGHGGLRQPGRGWLESAARTSWASRASTPGTASAAWPMTRVYLPRGRGHRERDRAPARTAPARACR